MSRSDRYIKNSVIDKIGSLNHLSEYLRRPFGRSFGKKVMRYRHRGAKRKTRIVDFYKSIWNIFGTIIKCDYDYLEQKNLVLVAYACGFLSYLSAIYDLRVGYKIIFNSFFYKISINKIKWAGGFLYYIPQQRKINNLEIKPARGSQIIRSSGCYGKIKKKEIFYCWIKLPSGQSTKLSSSCFTSLGSLKFSKYNIRFYKKAGFTYLLGFKPRVRGVAKNPIDHPHGGGEGKKSGKSISMSPWGKLIKGRKTSKKYIYARL